MVPVSHKSHSVVFHHIHMYDQFGFEKTNKGFVGNGVALIGKNATPGSGECEGAE